MGREFFLTLAFLHVGETDILIGFLLDDLSRIFVSLTTLEDRHGVLLSSKEPVCLLTMTY